MSNLMYGITFNGYAKRQNIPTLNDIKVFGRKKIKEPKQEIQRITYSQERGTLVLIISR